MLNMYVKTNRRTILGPPGAGGPTRSHATGSVAEVVDPEGASDRIRLLAAQECQTSAINVIDKESGKRIWPPS